MADVTHKGFAPHWEHFPHDADTGVRGIAGTPQAAVEQAALALTAVLTDPAIVRAETPVEISCEAPSHEMLLVEWLNAIIFEMATRRMIFARYHVRLEPTRLTATAWGETIDVERHQPAAEAKGATYTALSVKRRNDGQWLAQCVVDV